MLGSVRPSVFIATTKAEASRAFYTDVIGLDFIDDFDFAIIFNMSGTELRIAKVAEFTPHPFTVLDWQVDDIRLAMADLKQKGIVFIHYDFLEQDKDGIWTVTGGTTEVAWFKDPDDNVLSISQQR